MAQVVSTTGSSSSFWFLKLPLMLKLTQKTQAFPAVSPDACSDRSLSDTQNLLGTNFTEETYYA